MAESRKLTFLATAVILAAGGLGWWLSRGGGHQTNPQVEEISYLSEEESKKVFQRVFWRSLKDEDLLLRATRDESTNDNGLRTWVSQIEFQPGEDFKKWLDQNPFELSEADYRPESWLDFSKAEKVFSDREKKFSLGFGSDGRVFVYSVRHETRRSEGGDS